ncbi:MAG: class II aldolase/adducin family protein [Synergistaceae bacterium]|nr:class II aldolase/adducin family protein [Synergistaceae bacterium]
MLLLQRERNQVVEYCLKMSEKRLSPGTSGNISVRNPENKLIALSPSGMDYYIMKPEDVVILNPDGSIADGIRKPSSEWRLHTDFYRAKPDMFAIVHTHSIYCTVLACLGMPLKAVHYAICDSGVCEIPVAPYRTFGTQELSDSVIESIGSSRGVLLQNHGMVACGININRAFSLAENMEFCAEIQWRCLAVGQPNILDQAQMSEAFEQFKTYGQRK